jgi:hypothetical protein
VGLDLNGKVALVTGADQGIGAATSAELVREDMHLCRAARDSARLQSVTDTLVKRKANVTVLVTTAEAPDPATDGQAIARVVGHFSRLDLPVNNAEATKRADFFTLTEENWQWTACSEISRRCEIDPRRVATSACVERQHCQYCWYRCPRRFSQSHHWRFSQGRLADFIEAMVDSGHTTERINAINPRSLERDRFTRNLERAVHDPALDGDAALTRQLSSHGIKRAGKPDEIGLMVAYWPRQRRLSFRAP